MPQEPTSFVARIASWLPFVASAFITAMSVRLALHQPRVLAVLVPLATVAILPGVIARRRVREILRSGDVSSVLAAWSQNFSRLPHPETMTPLVTAAAFASCGWVERARTELDRSVKGPAWEAAIEHRLFVETLLDAFEGDREGALDKASRIGQLPLPSGPFHQARVRTLRDALGAFARAFAHTSRRGDLQLLERAAKKSPLVHWAMRYAAAVVAVDQGDLRRARAFLERAPAWPSGSAFRAFQAELGAMVGRPG